MLTINYTDGTKDVYYVIEKPNGTYGLEYYLLPDGTYGIKAGTTRYLENIVIPAQYNGKNVTRILDGAFENCLNLQKVVLPETINKIDARAFYGCEELQTINLPDTITSIGEYAFYNCQKLSIELVIPSGVTTIETYTFYGCSSVKSVVIPETVKKIRLHAFERSGLKNADIKGNTNWNVVAVNTYFRKRCNDHGGYYEKSNGDPTMQTWKNDNWKKINLSRPSYAAEYLVGANLVIQYDSDNDKCAYGYYSYNATISRD